MKKPKTTKRRRSTGRGSAIKNTGIATLVGVVAGAVNEVAASNAAMVRNNWWLGPGAMLLVGGYLTSRGKAVSGAALCGAAGTMGYFNMRMASQAKRASGGAAPAETAGLMNQPIARALPRPVAPGMGVSSRATVAA